MGITLEICCATVADVRAAVAGGADRIELANAFYMGGLTPSMGTLEKAKAICKVPIAAIVRPRGGGFCYTQDEYDTMLCDAKQLLEAGVDGIVFGFLTEEKQVDMIRTQAFVDLIHAYGKEAVFHKAFDCIQDQETALRQLIELQVDRVLTSGGGRSAIEKKEKLKHLIDNYGKQITILLGGGIRANNVGELLQYTGATQIHTACSGFLEDFTVSGNCVSYAYRQDVAPQLYEAVDADQVKAVRFAIEKQKSGGQ